MDEHGKLQGQLKRVREEDAKSMTIYDAGGTEVALYYGGSTYVVAKFELADGTDVAQYFEYYTDDEYIYVQASDLMLDGHIADYDGMMWFYEDLYYTISDPYYYD